MVVFHPRTRLDSYVEGGLSPSSHERVSAHVEDCEDCWREVDQRERILRITSSLEPVRAATPVSAAASSHSAPDALPDAVPDSGRSGPVLERRDGVPGWKVVLGAGAVGLLATGVLATAWIAGGPVAADDGRSQLLSSTGNSAPAGHDDGRSSAPSTPGPDSTGPSSAPDAMSSSDTPAETPASGALAPAGAPFSSGISPATRLALTPSMLGELRQAGWNVPTFHGLGMVNESTGWHRGEDVAEVVVTLADDGHTLRLHECRTLQDGGAAPSCPLGWTGDPAGAEDADADVDVVGLPVGVDMVLQERADGSWTATLSTAQAGYAVDSDLPVEDAPRVMSMVVISERSRVQAGAAPESPTDRLARGFERLIPWTDVTGPE